jgi:protein SCO1/2
MRLAYSSLRSCIISCLGFAMLFAASTSAASTTTNDVDAAALRVSQAAIGRTTGDHRLVDQHGQPLSLADLRGSPLVVSLVFTNCYTFCSGLTLHLREAVRIAREALGEKSFAVLTVGFDTANDTPRRMLAYGRDRGIKDPRWYFASGDAATIQRLTDDVGFTWAASPRGFDHIAQVTVIDDAGTVVQQIYGEDFSAPELVEPLKSVLLGSTFERPSVRGLLASARIYCSVYDPVSGKYRLDLSMFASAIPALMVLGILAGGIVMAGRRNR